MEDLKIILVQCHQYWEDKTANFKHVEKLLEGSQPADLIVLPEMFNTGFTMSTNFAEDEKGESISFLKSLAKKHEATICASLIFHSDLGFTNRMVMVDEFGIQSFYDKAHLFSLAKEHETFQPGTKRVVFELKGWRILMQVCYDLRFPVFSRYTTDDPYDIAVYIANWPEKRRDAWIALLRARAIENQSFVIGCNRVGEDNNGLFYSGDSAVYDALGGEVLKSTIKQEVVKYFVFSRKKLDEIRLNLPFLKDADSFTVKSKKYGDE